MQHMNATKPARLPSVVETISLGFGIVNRCLWVLIIPIILDIVYWLGPRLSVQPLIEQLVSLSQALGQQALDQQAVQAWQAIGTQRVPFDLAQLGLPRATNLFAPKYINLLTPGITPPNPPIEPSVWLVDNLGVLLGIQMLAIVGSLLCTSIYLFALAHTIKGEPVRSLFRRWLRGFGSILCIALLFVAVGLVIIVPLSLVIAVALLFSPVLAQLVVLLGGGLLIWLLFTASFSFDAVFMSDQGPFRALLTSLYVVQRSFWSAAGLFLILWVVVTGMSLVWQALSTTTIGLAIAIIASAYITTGLAAAHLIFFRDRLSRIGRNRN